MDFEKFREYMAKKIVEKNVWMSKNAGTRFQETALLYYQMGLDHAATIAFDYVRFVDCQNPDS